jgi:3D (Asp-Asp-Asp) domain-containing protein
LFATALAVSLLISADASAHTRRPIRITSLRLDATAYCQRGPTASGIHARPGGVAADLRRLPLGTRIQILATDKSYAGIYTVMDTGSRMKGRKLDIFMPSCAKARKFGRRVVEVRVLKEREQS